jgi:hypothetical protein
MNSQMMRLRKSSSLCWQIHPNEYDRVYNAVVEGYKAEIPALLEP